MKVRLEHLSWNNVEQLFDHDDSSSEFYELPNKATATDYLSMLENQARNNTGYTFNAYDFVEQSQLVGGGQIFRNAETVNLGWWVVKAFRRQGYGKAIAHALEVAARTQFPEFQRLEVSILRNNKPSLLLARSMGYTAVRGNVAELIFREKPHI